LRLRCFSALLAAEWRWITAGSRSDHANLLLTNVLRVGIGLNSGLSLLATLASLVAYLLAAFALSWSLAALALVSGGLVFTLLSGQRRKAQSLGDSLSDATRAMYGSVQESLAGMKLTKILGSESRHLNTFQKVIERLRTEELRFQASTSLTKALFQFGGAALLVLYLYMGLEVWHSPLPELLILVLIFSRLIPMFSSAQQQYHHWLHALPALQETDEMLAECEAAAEPKSPQELSHWPVHKMISLQQVKVHYSDRRRPAMDQVTFNFPARTTSAIMGASGAG
jgi:ATP-binding cassette subfamily C protein